MSDQATMNPSATEQGGDSGAAQVAEPQVTETPSAQETQEQAPELPKWHYQLPGELQGNEHLRKYSSLGELAKQFVDREAKADRLIELPGEDDPDDTYEAFFNRIGRPETPEAYELQAPENRDELGYTEEQEKEFRKTAHELGLTNGQAKALHDWQMQRVGNALKAQQDQAALQKEESVKALQKEWGDNFKPNVAAAQRAFNHFGGDELLAYLKETGQQESPQLLKAFKAIYDITADDELVNGKVDKFGNASTDWYPSMD